MLNVPDEVPFADDADATLYAIAALVLLIVASFLFEIRIKPCAFAVPVETGAYTLYVNTTKNAGAPYRLISLPRPAAEAPSKTEFEELETLVTSVCKPDAVVVGYDDAINTPFVKPLLMVKCAFALWK